jgi:hypothetical protein
MVFSQKDKVNKFLDYYGREKIADKIFGAIKKTAQTHNATKNDMIGLEGFGQKFLYEILSVYDFKKEINNVYIITKSVTKNINRLIANKDKKDWSVFENIKNGEYHLLLSKDEMLKVIKDDKSMKFWSAVFTVTNEGVELENAIGIYDFQEKLEINLLTFQKSMSNIITDNYALLCFFFLSENDEIVVKPNSKVGKTRKDKIVNKLPFELTIVNSRWNTDIVREEGFGVRGHFALRRCGEGRKNARVVFIAPFQKNGYRRIAKSKTLKN